MKLSWLLPVILVLVAVVLLFDWDTETTDSGSSSIEETSQQVSYPPVTLQWDDGVAQRYIILSDSTMHMQAAPQSASDIRVQLSAQLDSLILNVENDTALVGMLLSSVELTINDQVDAETNRALSVPFRVLFANSGMPVKFEFPAGVEQQNRTILENLIRIFQITMNHEKAWSVNESNGMGSYLASYKRVGATQFEKSKSQLKNTVDGMVSWSEIVSNEQFRIDPGSNWISEMTVQETMQSEGQATPAMTVENRATLKQLAGIHPALTADLWIFTATAAEKSSNSLVKKMPGMTADKARKQILATIPELNDATQGRLSHIHRLRDLLRVDSSLPSIVLDALKTQDLTDRTRADLYLALELTGTDSAQAALVEVITDDNWSLEDGMRAIVAMGGVKQPNVDSITALWEESANTSGGERQRMTSSATFALGSVGNTMNKADDPEYANLRSGLLSNAFGAGDTTYRSNFIRALGNTHDETLANDVVTLLDDSDPGIRRAAALSLGTLGADQVAEQLVSHYRNESNHYVRGAIAESLQSWSQPDEAAMAMFRQTVRSEKDERTRLNIATILSDNLEKFPENETVLRDIMRNEPSKRIRQQVANALAKQPVQP